MRKPKFINGFDNWMETFYEVVSFIELYRSDDKNLQEDSVINRCLLTGGCTEMYNVAYSWTNDFEKLNKNREWDGEFWDEIETFCKQQNKIQ